MQGRGISGVNIESYANSTIQMYIKNNNSSVDLGISCLILHIFHDIRCIFLFGHWIPGFKYLLVTPTNQNTSGNNCDWGNELYLFGSTVSSVPGNSARK